MEGYIIEKEDPETGLWIPVTKSHVPEAEVNGLTPGKSYKFRVKAVNKEGESEPLETFQPVVAKDPFGMHYFKMFYIKEVYRMIVKKISDINENK